MLGLAPAAVVHGSLSMREQRAAEAEGPGLLMQQGQRTPWGCMAQHLAGMPEAARMQGRRRRTHSMPSGVRPLLSAWLSVHHPCLISETGKTALQVTTEQARGCCGALEEGSVAAAAGRQGRQLAGGRAAQTGSSSSPSGGRATGWTERAGRGRAAATGGGGARRAGEARGEGGPMRGAAGKKRTGRRRAAAGGQRTCTSGRRGRRSAWGCRWCGGAGAAPPPSSRRSGGSPAPLVNQRLSLSHGVAPGCISLGSAQGCCGMHREQLMYIGCCEHYAAPACIHCSRTRLA